MNGSARVEEGRSVEVSVGQVILKGNLVEPERAGSVVLFAHGSGSSRFSPRNLYVAQVLHEAGLGTLLIDLLTADEEKMDIQTRHLRFDIGLLSERLVGATDWIIQSKAIQNPRIGYFGASTGAAAAIVAAAGRPNIINAVVSRGGRPDLARSALFNVKAPTLLIVGGKDFDVIGMNREALEQLRAKKEIMIIPGATHLFEEPGTLEEVARLATNWFVQHLNV